MLKKLLSLVGGWLNLAQLAAIAAVASYALYIVHDYKSLAAKNATLIADNSTLKNKVDIAKANTDIANTTILELDARLKQKSGDLDDFCAILSDIKGGKDEVGDPIGSTLEALKKRGEKK